MIWKGALGFTKTAFSVVGYGNLLYIVFFKRVAPPPSTENLFVTVCQYIPTQNISENCTIGGNLIKCFLFAGSEFIWLRKRENCLGKQLQFEARVH